MGMETEIVIFCKIGDFNGLKEADYTESQEQLELFVPAKGRLRVRKTIDKDGTRFEVCVKTLKKQDGASLSCEEVEEPVSAQYMEAFRGVAETLQIKTRYCFNGTKSLITNANQEIILPTIKYEVDVFKRHDGQISNWCKIDIELDEFMKALKTVEGLESETPEFLISVTQLPFKPQEAFIVGICTDAQKALMSKLWETEFTQNPFGGPRVPVSSTVSKDNVPPPEPDISNKEGVENERADDKSI